MTGAPWLEIAFAGGLGLLLGSFLNVVVYRLPQMMERQWAQDCLQYLNEQEIDPARIQALWAGSKTAAVSAEPLDLLRPRSRCRQCRHSLRWYQNIPLLSYALLRGKCANCAARIGLRYPLVEIASGLLLAFCAWRWGLSWPALAWAGFCATLLTLALIDWDTTLLPDSLTLPLLWTGLMSAAWGLSGTGLQAALWGAVAGYLSLWSIYWVFKLLTGKEGMGHGDFKLFAALGAWFGLPALVPIILMASVVGALVGLALKLGPGLRAGGYIPFGPFLACAALVALVFGPQAVLRALGL